MGENSVDEKEMKTEASLNMSYIVLTRYINNVNKLNKKKTLKNWK